MRVNHVTPVQFQQVLKNHVARNLSEADVNLLIEKFTDNGMVNYVAFAAVVDPKVGVGATRNSTRLTHEIRV